MVNMQFDQHRERETHFISKGGSLRGQNAAQSSQILSFFNNNECYCSLSLERRGKGFGVFGDICSTSKLRLLERAFSVDRPSDDNSDETADQFLDFWRFSSKKQMSSLGVIIFLKKVFANEPGKIDDLFSSFLVKSIRRRSIDFIEEINKDLSKLLFSFRLVSPSEGSDCLALDVFRYNNGFFFEDPYFQILYSRNQQINNLQNQLSYFLIHRPKRSIPNLEDIAFSDIRILNVGQANFVIGESQHHQMDICFDCGFDIRANNQADYSKSYQEILHLGSDHIIILSHFDLDHFLASTLMSKPGKRVNLAYSYWIIPDPRLYLKHDWHISINALSLLGFLFYKNYSRTFIFGSDFKRMPKKCPLQLGYGKKSNKNDHSIVSALHVGSHYCVMPGDASYEAWPSFVFQYPIDFLVVPHHGYRLKSPMPPFSLGKRPRCFVCCGENFYGHPNFEHLCALHRFGFKRIRFDNHQGCCTVAFTRKGGDIRVDYCSTKIRKFYYVYR
jgi:hypothetical protein